MAGTTVTKNSFLYRLPNFKEKPEDECQNNVLQNVIRSEEKIATDMEDVIHRATPVYTTSIETSTLSYLSSRTKSIQEAKNAFLSSTITETNNKRLPPLVKRDFPPKVSPKKISNQITVSNKSEDSRITGGGGKDHKDLSSTKSSDCSEIEAKHSSKKSNEVQTRKVSFKTKNGSATHKRSALNGKTTVTITSNKVAELTRRYNDMVQEKETIRHPRLARTIEKIQNLSKQPLSNSSTPSSTLSAGASIKIIVRQKRSNRNRNLKKRCFSFDSIDKIELTDSPLPNKKVFRTKSDGNRKIKSPRKKLHYPALKKSTGTDIVDGISKEVDPKKKSNENIISDTTSVKNAIQKFECEISASKKEDYKDPINKTDTLKTKPKVPEKKSSVFVTKNVVLKDGIPKIKMVKQAQPNEVIIVNSPLSENATPKKKESIYDRRKYKTNYIPRDKLTLQVVEIIHEDVGDNSVYSESVTINKEEEKHYQDITARITPNESFLWRRKSSCPISLEAENASDANSYGVVESVTSPGDNDQLDHRRSSCPSTSDADNSSDANSYITVVQTFTPTEINKLDLNEEAPNFISDYELSENSSINESRVYLESNISDMNSILDLENVNEALNQEVIAKNTTATLAVPEDDYETFAVVDDIRAEVTTEAIRTSVERQLSKINCPLPDIPKEPSFAVDNANLKENIYQCLLEMRSHPEGDDSSVHSYELCDKELEERTRGDGDSDDGYEYCKSPYTQVNYGKCRDKPLPPPPSAPMRNSTNYEISKSVSTASTVSYERIGSDVIYEKIHYPPKPLKDIPQLPIGTRDSIVSSEYTGYNDGENIYDTIKQPDGTSISNCYESIPNSPNVVKLRNNFRKQLTSAIQKRLSFDSMSNISRSTLSSEQKTNSIYGQRSIISFSGQEIAFQVPNSDTSVSDRSDRSEDWVDMSDQEEDRNGGSKIIIVRERSRKSPISWSQKVRHQWQNSPKQLSAVFITSPSTVYIDTSIKSQYYSTNDDAVSKIKEREDRRRCRELQVARTTEVHYWLIVRTITGGRDFEVQDISAFIEADSSDSSHYYESLNVADASVEAPRTPRVPTPYDDDFDSFDSDSDTETTQPSKNDSGVDLGNTKLPEPPATSTHYTLTKFASAARRVAGQKMRELTRNFTKRHSDYGKTYPKTPPSNEKETIKQKTRSMIYESFDKIRPQESRLYSNLPAREQKIYAPGLNMNKTETSLVKLNGNAFNDELKEKINEKRLSICNGDVPPPLPDKPTTPTTEQGKGKDSGTLSRKTYFSFKSRFRRATSMAIDINSEVPSALKITNSTFYLTDSMDGDSGFSNCSDSGQLNGGSAETLQPLAPTRKHRDSGTRLSLPKVHKYESSPELAATEDRPRLERPTAPPPPPPTDLTAVNAELKRLLPSLSKKDKSPRTRTSWYAECGTEAEPQRTLSSNGCKEPPTASSWYAEVGLYQEGNVSTSSGASSSASPLPQHSLFTSEPLYQFYNAAKIESVCRENVADSDSDGYETVNEIKKKVEQAGRTSAMWLVAPPRGPSRTLWCELPEVANSTLLNSLTPSQKRLQEAKFELVTSEASYLNSLSVLETHFICHPAFRDEGIISRTDKEILFNTIIPVRKCSALLMKELERCWQRDVLLQGLCETVRRHAERHFRVYVEYCENQIFLVNTLQRLKSKPQFAELLTTLESHPACQSLSLHSFLMLPMQRVTRLPLLVDAVLRNMDPADDEYQTCMDTLATLNNFVSQCNEGARNMERIEEMCRLSSCIEFPAHMRSAPELAPSCSRFDAKPIRWLVRSGELTQLIWRGDEQLKLTFGKKFQKVPLHLFLFTDMLVITKKKGIEVITTVECIGSEESYLVVDYCQRSLIEISSGDVMTQLNMKETPGKHVMLLTLLENYENKTVEMLMSCSSETDASRWREAMAPPGSEAGECVYAGWDCPQVAVLYSYTPGQPDELALEEGDIVNVTRKMPEGWYYGERIRDGETGWFPGSYTVEVASPHVRARNLRQRYRLLALSGSYLGQRKKT